MAYTDFVEHPELMKHYLIKRNKSGSASKRAQPGLIVGIDYGDERPTRFEVLWHYDNHREWLVGYYGLAKTLTRSWLLAESRRTAQEAEAAAQAQNAVRILLNAAES